MNGYIRNKTAMWTHTMKRAIGPGATVPLKELYKQYGKKHDLAEGEEFTTWLRAVKIKDAERWEIVLEVEDKKAPVKKAKGKKAADKVKEETPVPVIEEPKKTPTIKEMGIEDIVMMSVREAREKLPKITDIKLLKYALEEATPRAGKDSLIRLLRKRITDITISR